MKLIKSIYKAPYTTKVNEEEECCTAILTFQGKKYGGVSFLHPEDKDFFSPKVGCTIALSRARINCMRGQVEKLQTQIKERELFLLEVSNFGLKDVDPDNLFYHNLQNYCRKVHILQVEIEKANKQLEEYIAGQAKALNTIKRLRGKSN